MHLEALESKQKQIFEKLKYFSEFYLAGGTSLVLQIGHRISADFALFSSKEISKDLLDKVKKIFKKCKIKTIINHSGQLSVEINGIKMDFIKYTFPLASKPIKLQEVNILKVSEIAAMKAYALNRRGTLKDYVDLYFILKDKHTTLKNIKKIAEKKYKDEFNFRLFLEQLVYLEDIEEEKIEFLKEKIAKNQLQKFFENEVKKLN